MPPVNGDRHDRASVGTRGAASTGARARTPLGWLACAALVGLGLGEVLVRGPLAARPARVLFVSSPGAADGAPPVLLAARPRARDPGASPADPTPVDSSAADAAAPDALADWLPRDHSDPDRRGGAGAGVLQANQWHHQASTRGHAINDQEAAILEEAHAEYVAALREDAEVTAGLGPVPWADATFRVAGTLGRVSGPDLLVVGRDFIPDAGVDASLAWYEASYGRALTGSARESALRPLREYEVEKRQAVVTLVEAITARLGQEQPASAGDAFLLTVEGLILLRRSESAALEAALASLASADAQAEVAFREILR